MTAFSTSRQIAFDKLAKGNVISRLPDDEKNGLPFLSADAALGAEVFLVNTEYLNRFGIGEDISLYMVLRSDFPLSLPVVYLPLHELERVKYIPHVDVAGQVCTFDAETTRTNPDDPRGVVQDCLSRAIRIIEAGIAGTNAADFEDEFRAYWENQYENEPDMKQDLLVLLDEPGGIADVSLVKLSKPLSTYHRVIYQDNETGRRFLNYLAYRKITHTEQSICYIGEINFACRPPLVLTNESVAEITGSLASPWRKKFRKYINGKDQPKFIFGYRLVHGKPLFLGWVHGAFNLKHKGFRIDVLNNYYVLTHQQKKDKLVRVKAQIFTPEQRILRTDGLKKTRQPEYKFLVAGLGSIGSNLLYFLNGVNNPELRLVDDDELRIDNLNRHFLGFGSLGVFKAVALKNYYTAKNPFQVISSKNESIIETCQNDPVYINEADFIFCAIGDANIEQWIGAAQLEGIIKKPIFFLWVEPYLSGGHCLYLHPGGKSYGEFFDGHNFWLNNIIANEEYQSGNPQLSMREAGCQLSYVPYSLNDVTAFLSAVFPRINAIIAGPPATSLAITWLGDLQNLEERSIRISDFAKAHLQEALIVTV